MSAWSWGGVCLVPGGSAWSGGESAWSQGGLPGLGGVVSAWSWAGVCLVPGGGLPGRGGCLPGRGGLASQHALRQTPLLWTESQTPVKTLPWPNFVAAGNKMKI